MDTARLTEDVHIFAVVEACENVAGVSISWDTVDSKRVKRNSLISSPVCASKHPFLSSILSPYPYSVRHFSLIIGFLAVSNSHATYTVFHLFLPNLSSFYWLFSLTVWGHGAESWPQVSLSCLHGEDSQETLSPSCCDSIPISLVLSIHLDQSILLDASFPLCFLCCILRSFFSLSPQPHVLFRRRFRILSRLPLPSPSPIPLSLSSQVPLMSPSVSFLCFSFSLPVFCRALELRPSTIWKRRVFDSRTSSAGNQAYTKSVLSYFQVRKDRSTGSKLFQPFMCSFSLWSILPVWFRITTSPRIGEFASISEHNPSFSLTLYTYSVFMSSWMPNRLISGIHRD